MRKFIYIIAAVCSTLLCVNACQCTNENVSDSTVEDIITKNIDWMEMHYGSNYRWFETYVTYNAFLDEENDGSYATINSVFQYVEQCDSTTYDTQVVLFTVKNGVELEPETRHDFWVGDAVMHVEDIEITFNEAFQRVMESNYPKPHSKNCVLRKEVGSTDYHPQYIFGNPRAQLYVDAVTGEVTDENPIYENYGFKMPLGEWP